MAIRSGSIVDRDGNSSNVGPRAKKPHSAIIRAGAVFFYMSVENIDRESFRFFLTNCAGLTSEDCKVPLLVIPTGTKRSDKPVLKSVKIAR